MMWNFLVSGLTVGAAVVLFEGNPGYPDLGALFRLADAHGVTYFGTSAPFIEACRKAGLAPKEQVSLAALKSVGSTGAPLSPDGFAWVYDAVKADVLLGSVSGGTDLCTAFLTSCPLLPVHAGELQCAALGALVSAFSASGEALPVGELGELVLSLPMPSMPLHFLHDPEGIRLREAYFSDFPGVWRHADWVRFTSRGSAVVEGRSDSTLNRGGVRMGTADFYRIVEGLPEVTDSLVVDTSRAGGEGELLLFVVLRPGHELDLELLTKIHAALRAEGSPRHVPDRIVRISVVPRTLNGKKVEVPVKRLLMGVARERALNPGTLHDVSSVDALLEAEQASRA
jgi:acetoacetyl-CoA synthetase